MSLRALLLTLIMFTSLNAKIVAPQDYDFPYVGNLLATIGATLIKKPSKRNYEVKKMRLKTRRPKTPIGFGSIRVHYFSPKSKESKRVVFVMTGIGGDGKGNLGNFLANHLAVKGFHAFVIPSLFFKRFAYAASEHGHPGHIAEDVKDYYKGMQKLIKVLNKRIDMDLKDINLLGYSLGGITALHLAHEDSLQKVLNFKKIIALNPPVDVKYGIELLDSYYMEAKKLKSLRKVSVLLKAGKNILKSSTPKPTLMGVSNFYKRLGRKTTDRDLKFLISQSMRESLPGIVRASQRAKNNGSLPRFCKQRAAKKFTFTKYIEDILLPFYRKRKKVADLSFNDLSSEVSMPILSDFLKSADNIYLMHNADDVLLRDGDVEYMDNIFKDRSLIFPRGGHLGNLWHPRSIGQICEWLK